MALALIAGWGAAVLAAFFIVFMRVVYGKDWAADWDFGIDLAGKIDLNRAQYRGLATAEDIDQLGWLHGMPAAVVIQALLWGYGPRLFQDLSTGLGTYVRSVVPFLFESSPSQGVRKRIEDVLGSVQLGGTLADLGKRFGIDAPGVIAPWLNLLAPADQDAPQATANAVENWLRYGGAANGAPSLPPSNDPQRPDEPGGSPRAPYQPIIPWLPSLPDWRPPDPVPTRPPAPPELPQPGPAPTAPTLPDGTPAPAPTPGPDPFAPVPGEPPLPDIWQPAPGTPNLPTPTPAPVPAPPPAPAPGPTPIPPGTPTAPDPGAPPPGPVADIGELIRVLIAQQTGALQETIAGLGASISPQLPDLGPLTSGVERIVAELSRTVQTSLDRIAGLVQPTLNVTVQPAEVMLTGVEQILASIQRGQTALIQSTITGLETVLERTTATMATSIATSLAGVEQALITPLTGLSQSLERELAEISRLATTVLSGMATSEATTANLLAGLAQMPMTIVQNAANLLGQNANALAQWAGGVLGGGISVGLDSWGEDEHKDDDLPDLGGLLNVCADLRGIAAGLVGFSALRGAGGGLRGIFRSAIGQLGHLNATDHILAAAFSAALTPSHEITLQNVWKGCRQRIPTMGNIIAAKRLRLIDAGTYDDLIGRHGFTAEHAQIEGTGQIELPSPHELIEANFRRVTAANDPYVQGAGASWNWDWFRDQMQRLGYGKDDIEVYVQLAPKLPNPSDFIQFLVKDVYDPTIRQAFGLDQGLEGQQRDIAHTIGRAIGIPTTLVDDHWAAHWRLISPGQAFEMYWRLRRSQDPQLHFSDGELDKYLKQADYAPYWREKMKAITFRPMGRIDIRRAHALGIIENDDQLQLAYEALGYDERTTQLLINYTKEATKQAKLTETAAHRRAVVSKASSAYQRGVIGKAELHDIYIKLDYPEELAQLAISHIEMERLLRSLEDQEKLIRAGYVKRFYSREETLTMMHDIGVTDEALAHLMPTWDLARHIEDDKDELKQHKDLTRTELINGYIDNTYNRDQIVEMLTKMGYNGNEQTVLLRGAELKRARAQLDKAVETTHKSYGYGELDDTRARGVLAALGIPTRVIDEMVHAWQTETSAYQAASPNGSAPQTTGTPR